MNFVELWMGFQFVAESVKDFVDVLETLDEFRYLFRRMTLDDWPLDKRPTHLSTDQINPKALLLSGASQSSELVLRLDQ